jgi:hypothetical protein
MTRARLTSEAEFQSLMAEVDRQLQTEMVPIASRPMRAESILAVWLGETFVHPYPRREPAEGCYTGDDLTIRVSRWFRARYGDRLKMHFGPGRMVINLLGDPWLVRFPMLTGSWDLILSESEPSDPSGRVRRLGEPFVPLRYNIVESFVDFPPELVGRLSPEDKQRVLDTWRFGFKGLLAVGGVYRRHDLVRLALSDWEATVDQLSTPRGDNGLARWGSLQMAEKMLKAYIALRSADYKWSHDLAKLSESAEQLGLPHVDRAALASVQCSAGVRYGDDAVTLDSAIEAHHASLALSVHVADAITSLPSGKSS